MIAKDRRQKKPLNDVATQRLNQGNKIIKKSSRLKSSHLELNSNAMYSKAMRHSTLSSSNGNSSHHAMQDDENIYNTRLDAAIGAQKF